MKRPQACRPFAAAILFAGAATFCVTAAPAWGTGKEEGIVFRSADGSRQVRIRGYLQTDGRSYFADRNQPAADTFVIRRARMVFEATVYKHFDLRLMPDFGLGTTVLQDAYLDARFSPAATLRAGKFKTPFGLERLQSATDLLLVERAMPTSLAPNRDIGLMLHGEIGKGVFAYAGGLFNGVPDGASAEADANDGKEGAARVFCRPFANRSGKAVQGLGFGAAATYGSNHGTTGSTGLAGYKTFGQQTFFSYRSDGTPAGTVVAGGRRARISPQAFYYAGRFSLQAELVTASQEVLLDGATAELTQTAWQVSASLLLTDDTASYKGVDPKRPFDPSAGGFGALEIALRAGRLAIDRRAFPTFADPARSAREAFERAVGVSWYLNKGVRMMLDYGWTTFEKGSASRDRDDERVVLGRLQIAY
jgi:phosphate-selective porin OprO and OprP